jgi:hypothetical protein
MGRAPVSQWKRPDFGATNGSIVLSSRVQFLWAALVMGATASCASVAAFPPEADAEPPRDGALSTVADAMGPPDAGAPVSLGCASAGEGGLMVRLQLAPDAPSGDLWIAALCGRTLGAGPSDERMVRVVRVPMGVESITLSGLGDGFYRVVASLPGAVTGVSGVAAITRGASAVTFVSVGGPSSSALRVTVAPVPSVDAGIPIPTRDAGLGFLDAGRAVDAGLGFDGAPAPPLPPPDAGLPPPPPIADYAVEAADGRPLGRVGVRFNFREPGWVDASFDLENTCEGARCPTLRLQAIELRVEQDGLPRALVSLPLGTPGRGVTVAPRELFATMSRLVPMAVLDRSAQLQLTVYGAAE